MRDKGFSLLETVVALGLLSALLVAVLPSFFVMMHANTRNEERSAAVGAAQMMMEQLRQQEPASMPSSGSLPPQVVQIDRRDFEVVKRFCTTPQFCGADSRHVLIEVNYGGRKVFSAESVYTTLR